MLIKAEIGKPNKLSNHVTKKYSVKLFFSYDVEMLNYIRGLSIRAWDADSKCWEIPLDQLARLCDKFPQHSFEITGIYEEPIKEKLKDIPKSFDFKTKPFEHQIQGVRYGLTKERFILGDSPGLGKTKQVIDWACILKSQKKLKRVLIICGVNSLKYNWKNEVSTHSNEKAWVLGTRFRKNGNQYEGSANDKLADLNDLPDCAFLITNIETIRAGAKKEGRSYKFPIAEKIQELCESGEVGLIAFDESHKSKNPQSQQGRAMLKLSSKYMVAMSGTVLMNNPLDLYFPLSWLGIDKHSFYQFKQHYCTLGGYGGSEVVGYKNLTDIRELLDEFMLRRLKTEVLDLPEKIRQEEYVEMNSKQSKLYNEVLNNIKSDLHKISFSNNPLSMLIRLRQATAHTSILSETISESAKMERMQDLIEELALSGQKCIIFSNWESVTSIARNLLKDYNPAYITGATDSTARMGEVERFQNDSNCKVIIGTIGAMGTGLTLTAAQTVIFLDEPWNRALKDQCEDRAHRIGTKGTVNIITLLTKNTIDSRINDIVYKKGLLSDMLVDGKGGKIDMRIINQLIN